MISFMVGVAVSPTRKSTSESTGGVFFGDQQWVESTVIFSKSSEEEDAL